jgi:hypothetical protein
VMMGVRRQTGLGEVDAAAIEELATSADSHQHRRVPVLGDADGRAPHAHRRRPAAHVRRRDRRARRTNATLARASPTNCEPPPGAPDALQPHSPPEDIDSAANGGESWAREYDTSGPRWTRGESPPPATRSGAQPTAVSSTASSATVEVGCDAFMSPLYALATIDDPASPGSSGVGVRT